MSKVLTNQNNKKNEFCIGDVRIWIKIETQILGQKKWIMGINNTKVKETLKNTVKS